MNLRGVRESGTAFAIPTYVFIVGIVVMVGYGLFRTALGDAPSPRAPSYGVPEHGRRLAGLAVRLPGRCARSRPAARP